MPIINAGRARPIPSVEPTPWADFAEVSGTRIIVPNTVEVAELEPHFGKLKEIYIEFPAFTDGRGFSIARQLKRAGFTGEIIASGPLLPDQYAYALQCGFSSVKVDDEVYQRQTPKAWSDALLDFDLTYQRGYVTPSGPAMNVFELRRARTQNDLASRYDGLSAQAALRQAITNDFKDQIVMTSSLGVDSAVLLHMVSQIDKDVPILFLETEKHFKETLAYRDTLVTRLGLTNFRSIHPDPQDLTAKDPGGELHLSDRDGCCHIRKVLPLEREIEGYKARITGRKRYQTRNRSDMGILETDGDQSKLNPLAYWSARDVTAYLRQHDLPVHPLLALGFLSVGCAPCTTRVEEGEDPRAGRWRNSDKVECGIHFIDGKWTSVAPANT